MKRLQFSVLALALLFSHKANSQNHEDLLRFSTQSYSFGTARSAAMGGAFTSLGADLSSISLNPAGLGMYRRSEIGFSPAVTSVKTTDEHTDPAFGMFRSSSNQTRFVLSNGGMAINLYNGPGGVTSMTFGFAYNRMIDYNDSWVSRGKSNWSMLDVFAEQLTYAGIREDQIGSALDRGTYPDLVGALMAYEAYLIEPVSENEYRSDYALGNGSVMYPTLQQTTKGSTGQYDLSFGFNLSNKLYLGLGFGFQDLNYTRSWNYSEQIANTLNEPYAVSSFTYRTYLKQSGAAWNFKLGAIYRPVDELRIGAAFHTPTYVSMDEQYDEVMFGYFRADTPASSDSPYFVTSYDIQTPARFLGGASYVFGGTTLLSVDYERVWYDKMKLFWGSGLEDLDVSTEVQSIYKPANNFRIGGETLVAENFFLRLGYGYYDSMYKLSGNKKYGRSDAYSGGCGYRTGSWGIDFAYGHIVSRSLPYQSFYMDQELQSGISERKHARNNFILTASVRF